MVVLHDKVGDSMQKWHIFSSHMGEIILHLEFSDSFGEISPSRFHPAKSKIL